MSLHGILEDGRPCLPGRPCCMTKHHEDRQDLDVGGLDAFLGDALDADGDELGSVRATHEVGPLQRAHSVDVPRERVWDEVLRSERRLEERQAAQGAA